MRSSPQTLRTRSPVWLLSHHIFVRTARDMCFKIWAILISKRIGQRRAVSYKAGAQQFAHQSSAARISFYKQRRLCQPHLIIYFVSRAGPAKGCRPPSDPSLQTHPHAHTHTDAASDRKTAQPRPQINSKLCFMPGSQRS